jgi:hypothetical protein
MLGLSSISGNGSSSHNGGKTQVNLSFSYLGMFPFINNVLTASVSGTANSGFQIDPRNYDSNGYPTTVEDGGIFFVFTIPTQAERPGDYTLTFNAASAGATVVIAGVGTYAAVSSGPQSFAVSGATLAAQLNFTSFDFQGRYIQCRVDMRVTTVGVSNLHFFHNDDTAARAAAIAKGYSWGGFGQQFINQLKRGRPGVIRFLNMQDPSGGITTWALRRPTSYLCFSGPIVFSNLALGLTSGSGDSFTISGNGTGVSASGGPTDKMVLLVKFDRNGSTNANTLSLNGTTGRPMFHYQTSAAYTVSAGWSQCIYDADLAAWIVIPNISGVADEWPPEVMAALAYEIGAHPYFVTPWLTFTPLTDYMTSLASYVKATYQDTGKASWMVPRYEGPNESWNTAQGFTAGPYANAKATVWWSSPDGGAGGSDNYWYGYGLSNLGQAINAIYGSPNSKTQTQYQIVLGVQSGTYKSGTNFSDPRAASVRTPGYLAAAFAGGGSSNISIPGNTFAVNDAVSFASPSSLPGGYIYAQVVYVKTIGSTITVSATQGGAAMTFSSAGSSVVAIKSNASPAYNWATTVCCTNYYGTTVLGATSEVLNAYDYSVTYAGNATQQQQIAETYFLTQYITYADFIGTISGTTLTVSSVKFGALRTDTQPPILVGAGLTYGTQVTGGSGSTWTVTPSQSVGPVEMKLEGLLTSFQDWAAWGRKWANPIVRICNYEGAWSTDYNGDNDPQGHMTVNMTQATNTNPCVVTIQSNSTNCFGNGGQQNVQTYPSLTWVQVNFTGAWAGLSGVYKVTSGSDTALTLALDASSMASNYVATQTIEYFFSYGTGTVTITGNADGSGTMTVSGHTGDPIQIGETVYWSGSPFGGANGFTKVSRYLSGTGGNGTYEVFGSTTASISAQFFLEPWWIVNSLRRASMNAPQQTAIYKQCCDDMILNTQGGEFPSFYTFGYDGIWTSHFYNIYNAPLPQWEGVVQYNS